MSTKRLECHWLLGLCLLACSLLSPLATGQAPTQQSRPLPGHWVQAKGEFDSEGVLQVSSLELLPAAAEEVLVGRVTSLAPDKGWFELLGQRVHLSDRTRWRKMSVGKLVGSRVKVSGYYRGPLKFSARFISPRGAGRDSVSGRVDAVRAEGAGISLDVMRFELRVPEELQIKSEQDFTQLELIEPRAPNRLESRSSIEGMRERDDDDYIPGRIRLGETVTLGMLLEARSTTEEEYDLDGDTDRDRTDHELSLRAELTWRPLEDFYVLGGVRQSIRWRDDEVDGSDELTRLPLIELYGYWSDVFGLPLDLQVGLQDFDEQREWLWDQNLDAVRAIFKTGDTRLELAAATTLHDGGARAEETDTYIAYLYREFSDRLLGAYVVDTRSDLDGEDYPIHFGARMLGEWLPANDVWAELAVVRGYDGAVDIRGWGFDVGTTWSPDFAGPWYFNAGFAFGSGDDDSGDGVDHAFRQTGLHDNNDKLGGVTSYKYYGEVLEPELSNMSILTIGIGRRFARRHSVDLVYHRYQQDESSDRLRDTQLDTRPNGRSSDLGQGLDLIVGSRLTDGLDLEVVLGAFDPGDAFDDSSTALLGKLQLRMRF